MTAWLTEPFAADFMQRALLAGLLAVVTTSLVGTWVVIRGLGFMGDALAHGVLPGIAVAHLAGVSLVLGALAGAAAMVGGIALVTRRARLSSDTAIGLLFVGMLALGVIVISRAGSFAVDLTAFLFGDILGVEDGDLALSAAVAAVAVVATLVGYRAFLVLSFNASKAQVLGLRPGVTHVALLALVALAIVSSFRAVGTLLVFGLLIAPPATATLVVRRVPLVMAASTVAGAVAVVAGLLVSYHLDTAAGATVAGLAVAQFFVVLAAREASTWRRAGRASEGTRR